MGTRADFYVGKGKDAEWIGSIAWDGYREGIDPQILQCQSPEAFRHAVESFLKEREDATFPADGWPWPWDSSATTDCHYWHFDGRTWEGRGECERFGEVYVPCDEPEPNWEEGDEDELYDKWLSGRERVEFPDMSNKKNVTLGKRSGLMILSAAK